MADDRPAPTPEPPLARFAGARPPAPAWFDRVMAVAPEALSVPVAGARIDALAWGERGRPGLLLLHGAGAHAGWWRFIAPYLAETHRVAAFSLSGMGRSDWRPAYDLKTWGDEALAVAEAAGLYDTGKPVVAAHSFGGFVTARLAAERPERIGGGIVIDSFIRQPRPGSGRGLWEPRPTKVYPDMAAALTRFRLLPPQPVEDGLFLVDAIARESLAPPRDGSPGLTWTFDPMLWVRVAETADLMPDLLRAGAPMAMVCGEQSLLMPAEAVATVRKAAPDLPVVIVPEAGHHVMLSQPLAMVAALRGLLSNWPMRENR